MTRQSIPNLLTGSRAAVAVGIVLVSRHDVRIALLLWGAVSDFLDGFLARRFGSTSEFGAAFDLSADGLFFLACFLSFWRDGTLSALWFILILVGSIPELVAQAILFQRKIRTVGSPGRVWNKALGGYSYMCVIGMMMGLDAPLLAAGQVATEIWANAMDVVLALKSEQY